MTRQRKAVCLLKQELQNLQDHGGSPLAQAVIQRMIQRQVELKAVLEKILRYPKEIQSEEEQQLEQRKLIWLIAHAAAEIGGDHQSASASASLRAAQLALKKKLNALGKQAEELAATLDDINALSAGNGIQLPTWMSFDVLELMQRAAPYSDNRRAAANFKPVVSAPLEAFHERYWEYLPSLSDILQTLAKAAEEDIAPVENNYWFDLRRENHPAHDFIRTLILRIDSLPPPGHFEQLGFNAENLLNLAVVCLDLDEETDITRGIQRILKEHRERKASTQPNN